MLLCRTQIAPSRIKIVAVAPGSVIATLALFDNATTAAPGSDDVVPQQMRIVALSETLSSLLTNVSNLDSFVYPVEALSMTVFVTAANSSMSNSSLGTGSGNDTSFPTFVLVGNASQLVPASPSASLTPSPSSSATPTTSVTASATQSTSPVVLVASKRYVFGGLGVTIAVAIGMGAAVVAVVSVVLVVVVRRRNAVKDVRYPCDRAFLLSVFELAGLLLNFVLSI